MSTTAVQPKENKMGTMPINKLLLNMSLPMMIAMLIQALYNIIDSMFVAQISENALSAVSLAFPMQNFMIAVGTGTGVGVNALLSKSLGAKRIKIANKTANVSMFLVFMNWILFILIGLFVAKPFLMGQTKVAEIVDYGNIYLRICCVASLGIYAEIALERLLQATGRTFYTMITQATGAIVNIILDPILIYGFDMGVRGAAVATVISQTISAVWVLVFLTGKKTILKIKPQNMKLNKSILLPTLALGISPFIMQSTESLVQLTFNAQIKRYGGTEVDMLISAMSILLSCMQFFTLPIVGLTQGAQPIVSYNYGAKKIDRVKKAFRLLLTSAMIYTTTVWALTLLFPQVFIQLFSSDPALMEFAPKFLRIFMAGMLLLGAQFSCQQTFVSLGQAKVSMILALLRKIILLIPLALILPVIFGFNGILFAEPVADILASLSTATVFFLMTRKLFSQKQGELE